MTDTLKRLSGTSQITPAHTLAGTALYTPGNGVIAHCKMLQVTNHDFQTGAYLYVSLGAMTTQANRIVDGVWVPPSETLFIPLDFIVSNTASDVLNVRQSPLFLSARVVAPTSANTTTSSNDATSYASSTWAAKNNAVYILSVHNSKASAPDQPNSFTDTHTGISWTLLQTQASTDGLSRLSQYVAKSTGTTSTTTTVGFPATQLGCNFHIDELAPNTSSTSLTGWDNSDSNGATCVLPYGFTEIATATTTPKNYYPGLDMPPAGHVAQELSASGTNTTPDAAWTEIADTTRTTPAAALETSYILQPSTTYFPTITSAVSMVGWLGLYSAAAPLTVSLHGVENT